MPRAIAGRKSHGVGDVGDELSLHGIEVPHEDPIEPQIDMEHVAAVGGREDLVGMGAVMTAEGEAPRGGVLSFGRADLASILLDVAGRAQAPVGADREHRHRTTEIVGDEEVLAVRVETHVRRPGAP